MPMIHLHFIRVRIVCGGSLSFRSELSFATTSEIPYQGAQSSCKRIRVSKKLSRKSRKRTSLDGHCSLWSYIVHLIACSRKPDFRTDEASQVSTRRQIDTACTGSWQGGHQPHQPKFQVWGLDFGF